MRPSCSRLSKWRSTISSENEDGAAVIAKISQKVYAMLPQKAFNALRALELGSECVHDDEYVLAKRSGCKGRPTLEFVCL